MSSTAAETVFQVVLPTPVLPKGEREYRAFMRLLPSLLLTYEGKFVAIHDEQVVDSGDNDIELVLRVHQRFGYVPIHVGKVEGPILPSVAFHAIAKFGARSNHDPLPLRRAMDAARADCEGRASLPVHASLRTIVIDNS
jgi:hypothetical protein